MSLATAIANDYLVADNTETISFSDVGASSTTTTAAIAGALRRAMTKDEQAYAAVNLLENALPWSLPIATMPAVDPQAGDYITDAAGVKWYLTGFIEKDTLGSRWRVLTTKERT